MKLFIMQPMYLPWIGIFKAIDECGHFVFYDDVQFEKQSWQQRNRILNINENGERPFVYLSVPVEKHRLQTPICDIKIRDRFFFRNHLQQIRYHYAKASYTNEVVAMLESVYEKVFDNLSALNIVLTKALAAYLGLKTMFAESHELGIQGGQTERLVNMCRYFSADTYLSPVGSKGYLDEKAFEKAHVKLEFLNFDHPAYTQVKPGFVDHLSIVDLLVHEGPERSKEIIQAIQLKND